MSLRNRKRRWVVYEVWFREQYDNESGDRYYVFLNEVLDERPVWLTRISHATHFRTAAEAVRVALEHSACVGRWDAVEKKFEPNPT